MNKPKPRILALGIVGTLVVTSAVVFTFVAFNTRIPSGPISVSDKKFATQLSLIEKGDDLARIKALASINELSDKYSAQDPDALTAAYVDNRLVPELLKIAGGTNSDESRLAMMVLNKLLRQGAVATETTIQQVQDFFIDSLSNPMIIPDIKSPATQGLRHTLPLSEGNMELLFVALQEETVIQIKDGIARTLVDAAQHNAEIRERLDTLVENADLDEDTKAVILSAIKFDSSVSGTRNNILARGLKSESVDTRWQAMNSMMVPQNFKSASDTDVAIISALISNPAEPTKNRVLATELLGRMTSTRRFPHAKDLLITLSGDSSVPLEIRVAAIRSIPFAMNYSIDAFNTLQGLSEASDSDIVEAAKWGMRVIEDRQQHRHEATEHK